MSNRIQTSLKFVLLLQLLVSLFAVAGSERQVKFDGQSNFRDINGYQATDGRSIKWGEI